MNRYDMKEAYYRLKNEYFVDDLSVSYTLKTDDITKGAKPQARPIFPVKAASTKTGRTPKRKAVFPSAKNTAAIL